MVPSAVSFTPWTCCAQPPASITHPDQLQETNPRWFAAAVPGTVAGVLQAAGEWNLEQPLDADAQDWWYRTTFAAPRLQTGQPCDLCCDGLATLCEIWLNGERVLSTDNMFRGYRADIRNLLQPENELLLCFRSLAHSLNQKRPRPRWKTNLVSQQQLRWQRTTLLGRIPGWSPAVPPVGPWREIRVESGLALLSGVRLQSRLEESGKVTLQARLRACKAIKQATLAVGEHQATVEWRADADGWLLHGQIEIADPPLWWPHTHGDQPLLDGALKIDTESGHFEFPLGNIGFRAVRAGADRFGIEVNGVPIYCRGACWTVSDIVTLDGTTEALTRDLRLARDAGINMLRVGGTMIYESDLFYRLCDEFGILVWQDFMFANMDYPVEDAAFAANIEAEATYQIARLARHPSVALWCGNSEVEQQAAMLGMPQEIWRNRWFGDRLPALCAEHHPGSVYVPSTPSGGVLPFHVRSGVAHYYGVGAYLRSPADVRKDDVGFSPECLGFANIPEAETIAVAMGGELPVVHHPRWKQGVPRDTGAGWDFDDVRDFYLQHLFGVDPVRLRSFDPGRYLQLSRVASGEIMAQVFAEWRSPYSHNRGGLVWFFKDLRPGAGWGIVDSRGVPKAAYYQLRRCWQPRQIMLTDEGLEGLHVHVINETAEPLAGTVELVLLKDQHIVVARSEAPCTVAPRSQCTLHSDAILNGFYDVAYAYRFGPPKHDMAIATLFDERREIIDEAYFFPLRTEPRLLTAANVVTEAAPLPDGRYQVALQSDRFLHSVCFDVKGFRPDDNYFHLPPARRRILRFTPGAESSPKFAGHVEALNLPTPIRISSQGIAR